MAKKRPHWLDELSEDLREDLGDMKDSIIEAFRDISPLGGVERTPSRSKRVQSYLSMSPQQRQALFLELGAEGYTEFVDKAMDDLVSVFGSDANAALSWFAGVGPQIGLNEDEVETALISAFGGNPNLSEELNGR